MQDSLQYQILDYHTWSYSIAEVIQIILKDI